MMKIKIISTLLLFWSLTAFSQGNIYYEYDAAGVITSFGLGHFVGQVAGDGAVNAIFPTYPWAYDQWFFEDQT